MGAATVIALIAVVLVSAPGPSASARASWSGQGKGIRKIQHVVVIMQENRSFDQYFGTYPGLPASLGLDVRECISQPTPTASSFCQRPWHSSNDENFGGPHDNAAFVNDLNGGKLDGFYASALDTPVCTSLVGAGCRWPGIIDVMSYHDGSDIPNYWAYANHFVLQSRMYEPVSSWSLPAHLFMMSGWSALCTGQDQPLTCTSAIGPGQDQPSPTITQAGQPVPDYSWTDITWLLDHHQPTPVTWAYYVAPGTIPDCSNGAMACTPPNDSLNPGTPSIWNPLPYFDTVRLDNQLRNIQSIDNFFKSITNPGCSLPNVSWFTPSDPLSEHPPELISNGVAYVTGVINAIMRSSCWDSTAIFLTWDDWGGFYDGNTPPVIDANGDGFRVPGLVISPYAKRGHIDNRTLSHDAYLKFIEDDFLGGERICVIPGSDGTSTTSNQGCRSDDGRADNRPTTRENSPGLGNLRSDFDFSQQPLPPLILPQYPKTDLVAPPTATINSPKQGAAFKQHQVVNTSFSCADNQTLPGDGGIAPGIQTCTDSNGTTGGSGQLDTSKIGISWYVVQAISKDGSSATAAIWYRVRP